jgi:hypothetical protein
MASNNMKPLFTITPALSASSVCSDRPTSKTSDVEVGMGSTNRLLATTPIDDVASQGSRETLLSGERKESGMSIFSQVFLPFIIAGLGMVWAGVILDIVKVRLPSPHFRNYILLEFKSNC